LNDIAPLKTKERMALASAVHIRRLDPGELWLKAGTQPRELSFVAGGYLRKYFIKDGREVTDYFYLDNSFAGDLPGIITRRPAHASVMAMESTELFVLSYDTLNALGARYHAIEHILRVLVERLLITLYYRDAALLFASPEQRYAQLLRDMPGVFLRASPYHIASFLGITVRQVQQLSERQ
jgi:CRP/FNR family transcriptional regulator, anaerobic regulatory protein